MVWCDLATKEIYMIRFGLVMIDSIRFDQHRSTDRSNEDYSLQKLNVFQSFMPKFNLNILKCELLKFMAASIRHDFWNCNESKVLNFHSRTINERELNLLKNLPNGNNSLNRLSSTLSQRTHCNMDFCLSLRNFTSTSTKRIAK